MHASSALKCQNHPLDSLMSQNNILSSDRLLNFAKLLAQDEADVEDIFDSSIYLKID
jgi:hypothetical protein